MAACCPRRVSSYRQRAGDEGDVRCNGGKFSVRSALTGSKTTDAKPEGPVPDKHSESEVRGAVRMKLAPHHQHTHEPANGLPDCSHFLVKVACRLSRGSKPDRLETPLLHKSSHRRREIRRLGGSNTSAGGTWLGQALGRSPAGPLAIRQTIADSRPPPLACRSAGEALARQASDAV